MWSKRWKDSLELLPITSNITVRIFSKCLWKKSKCEYFQSQKLLLKKSGSLRDSSYVWPVQYWYKKGELHLPLISQHQNATKDFLNGQLESNEEVYSNLEDECDWGQLSKAQCDSAMLQEHQHTSVDLSYGEGDEPLKKKKIFCFYKKVGWLHPGWSAPSFGLAAPIPGLGDSS